MPSASACATGVAMAIVCTALSSGCSSFPGAGSRVEAPPPPAGVVESLEILHDQSRDRDVPIKIYAPSAGDGPFPVILFSHGLGSSRQGYVFLGREWARRGFVSIHLQHAGSDSEVLRERGFRAIYRAAFDAQEYADRPGDLSFVIDQFEARVKSSGRHELWGKLDLTRIGVGGHSYGAHTALTLVGMLVNFPGERGRSFRDERVKAALILSAPSMEWAPTPAEFAPIRVPTMHMSGTRDTSWLWKTTLAHRRRAFDSIQGAPRYFLNIDGGSHQTFADFETIRLAKRNGRLDRTDPPELRTRSAERQRQIDLVLQYSSAFWEAYLVGTKAAAQWLQTARPDGAVLERGE